MIDLRFADVIDDLFAEINVDAISTDDLADKRIIASVLKDMIESYIKTIDEDIKNRMNEPFVWENSKFSKALEFAYKKQSAINPKIVDELTDEECRKGYTVTEKAIKLSGRKDLLGKYKHVTESKTLTLKSLKG